MLGILVVDKPLGITSHDVVNALRRKLSTRRVGHAGTLDPLATGALVLAVGPATRFLQYLDLEPKEYEFTVRFGISTDTQDAEGRVTDERTVPGDIAEQIPIVLPEFLGEIQQIPPMYSAVKRDGKPLYFYARKGEEVERNPRTVFIHEWEWTGGTAPDFRFRCVCSGGTYVRTLAHDLGEKLGCGGHLIELRRTRVGRFNLDHAVSLEEASAETLVPLAEALKPMHSVTLPSEVEGRIREGQKVPIRPVPDARFVCMLDKEGEVIGVASLSKGSLKPECVIPRLVDHGAI